jgi:hypothetical protein
MCSVGSTAPTNAAPQYIHNPYLDGGAYGNSVDANRIGTSALTIGLDPKGTGAVGPGLTIPPGDLGNGGTGGGGDVGAGNGGGTGGKPTGGGGGGNNPLVRPN